MVQKMRFFSPDNGGGAGIPDSAPSGAPATSSPSIATTTGSPETTTGGVVESSLESSPEASMIGSQSDAGNGVSYVRTDGTFETDWQNRLPDDLAPARDSLGRFKNVSELAKAFYTTKQLVGRKGVILPTPESTPEEIAAYRKEMGVPENADGYLKETMPESLPEGIQWNNEIAKSYYEIAHKHNVSTAAMKDLIALNLKQREFEQQAQNETIMEQKQQGMSLLRHRWGADFDRNLGLAQRAVVTKGGNPNSYGWRDPDTVRVVVALASEVGEGKLVAPGGSLPMGSADMKSRALDIMTNKGNPEYQRYHDGDREVQAKVRRYLEQASGGK